MFVDSAEITVQAGNGGNGAVSFRHEIYVDKGGPDGGDGGNGGNVVLRASRNQNTLAAFRYNTLIKADDGKPGYKQRMHGKSAKHTVLDVPVGTVVMSKQGQLLADLAKDGQEEIIAKGGKGGFGNAHFTSSTRQTPRIFEKGEPGELLEAVLELKMIADVGLVGLPNAGKSSFLASVSNARPEIANYPFTTLAPHLGVVDIDGTSSLLIADIPGLIEGASEGKGLGDDFLRHVERTAVLLHLIDMYQEDIGEAYKVITKELKNYKVDLSKKPHIIALTKCEGFDEEYITERIAEVKKVAGARTKVYAISSHSKYGVNELLRVLATLVNGQRTKTAKTTKPLLPVLKLADSRVWTVKKTADGYAVSGTKIERFAMRTDTSNPEGTRRLKDIMKKMGIMRALEKQGIEAGQKIKISTILEIDY
jgi:GTP-binding protein